MIGSMCITGDGCSWEILRVFGGILGGVVKMSDTLDCGVPVWPSPRCVLFVFVGVLCVGFGQVLSN